MPRAEPKPKDKLTKLQRYRRAQTDRGVKLLGVRVPDPTQSEFAAEATRQARLLRGRPEEADALTFIEAAFPWPEK